MIQRFHHPQRRGTVLPLVTISLVALMGLVALAIDLGVMAVARNQCQNAADAAAMAGTRTLNGDTASNNNRDNAVIAAQTAAQANSVLSQLVQANQVSVIVGKYYYQTSTSSFVAFPVDPASVDNPNEPWTLTNATVHLNNSATFFGRVFGMMAFNSTATATAVHRPRDVVSIMDLSGSMHFDSLLGGPHSGSREQSMNPDPVFPTFGHYSDTVNAGLSFTTTIQVSSGEIIGPANDAVRTAAGPPLVNDFYKDTVPYGTSFPAFSSAPSSYASSPAGDNYLLNNFNSGTNYVTHVADFLNGNSARSGRFELDGYAAFPPPPTGGLGPGPVETQTSYPTTPGAPGNWSGYTQGPGYWGKTFFIWPPDPRMPIAAPLPLGTRQTMVKRFLLDFGFPNSSTAVLGINTPNGVVQGIYQANAVAGSQNWPWDTATNLQNYLTSRVGLTTTDPRYLRIMRLHNRPACDWRGRFFWEKDGVTPMDDNNFMYDSGGSLQPPYDGTTNRYRINYDAILAWIQSPPNPFPPQFRAGGVLYYDQIPSHIDTTAFPPTDPNQRFWKEYIDEVLGLHQIGADATGPIYEVVTPFTGYGDTFTWGTTHISARPSITFPGGSSDNRYIDHTDNPKRPKLHFWFGPLSLLDFIDNYNMGRFWWPGTIHEAPTWQCKVGMKAAFADIKNNHPNDIVAQLFFSSPKTAVDSYGFYNQPRVPLSRDYLRMQNSLWFSPRIIASPTPEIRPYDNNGLDIEDVPRSNGGTCYAMPLMLAYNQFNSSATLRNYASAPAPVGLAGGNGRRGAYKLIIFETDGMVNTTASANFTNNGPYNSCYNVRIQDGTGSAANEYPTNVDWDVSTATSQALAVASQICALDDASVPGYSTRSKPVLIHCIAFGSLFEPTNTSVYKDNALSLLQNLQYIGGKAGGEQPSPGTPLAPYKLIVGTSDQRISAMQQAFTTIMQDGVQVTLIR